MADIQDIFDPNPFRSRLLGHEALLNTLKQLTTNKRLPHAMLFTGSEGIGKRLAAYSVAAEILMGSAKIPGSIPPLLKSGNHPDLHPLEREEEKKDISVENIRGLRESLQLQPFQGSASVAIINDAHLMNIAASNALLLTLEEPASERFLILVTHAPQKLPETIVSRCQTVHFGELPSDIIQKAIHSLFPQHLEDKTLAALVTLCGNTLGPLQLGDFVHPRTLQLRSENESWKHVQSILERSRNIRESLRSIFEGEPTLPATSLSLASLLSEEKGDDLTWLLIRSEARRALREASKRVGTSEEINRKASIVFQALEVERLVRERNASPQLQLSQLFLESESK